MAETWRWNVNDVWQTFSSMHQEIYFAGEAANDFYRHHYLSSALLFGGCAVESFLNSQLRLTLEKTANEELIFKRLRRTSFREKLKKWPAEIAGSEVATKEVETIMRFLDLRNEVTHRKRRDHSLYNELEAANVKEFLSAIQEVFLTIYFAKSEAFPYWILGWNYVGMNGDASSPCIINNAQFRHSLRAMGYDIPASDYYRANAWEAEVMKTRKGFKFLQDELFPDAPDIEPQSERFPTKPRLSKRWWDAELIRKA